MTYCPSGARIVDTAPMSLDAIEAEVVAAHGEGLDVARRQSGDLSVYSALAEQLRRLERRGIPYTLTRGVRLSPRPRPRSAANSHCPRSPSVVLTRMGGRASRIPEGERLAAFAATGATLAIHLAIPAIATIVAELTPFYGADCPVAVVVRASWPDERIVRGTLGDIAAKGPPIRSSAPRSSSSAAPSPPRTSARARSMTPTIAAGSAAESARENAQRAEPMPSRWGAPAMTARGLIVAAARSGSGKTTVTLALLAALAQRGIAVRAAKAGPDYIDAAFHAAATGTKSINLDSWAMPPSLLDSLAIGAASDAELLVIEGVMGLFDGIPGLPGRCGVTADLAARFRLPVLLVLDVRDSRKRQRRWCADWPPMTRPCAWPVSCSIASAANAIARWSPMRSPH